MEGYAHVQSWSLVDMLMCRGGQWWICSGAGVVNCVYAQVQQWWSLVDMLTCKSDQLSICSCAVVLNSGYIHVQELSMVDMLMFSGGQW